MYVCMYVSKYECMYILYYIIYDNEVREKIEQQLGFTHDLLSYFGHVKIKFFMAGLQRKVINKRNQFERFYFEAKDLMVR